MAYEAAIYEITERLGPYYVLCENLALIHASNQSGVNDTQMAVTVLKGPVKFKPDGYDVRVLVTLVAKDSESHMEGIQAVSNIFSDEKKVQEILDATCPKEIFDLFVSTHVKNSVNHLKGGFTHMLEFIINILSTPAILVGLMSLLGLALQRKPIEDIVKGTVKTIVGFLVLSAGASFLRSGS